MKLIQFKIQGYKRFEDPSTLNVSEKLVAIIGPNEVGKTSMLRAMYRHIDDSGAFDKSELTRGSDLNDNALVTTATFQVEDDDLDKVAHLHQGAKIKKFSVYKFKDGDRKYSVAPEPERDKSQRELVIKSLSNMPNSPSVKHFASTFEEALEASEELLKALKDSREQIGSDVMNQIRRLSQGLTEALDEVTDKSTFPTYVCDLPDHLNTLVQLEEKSPPHIEAEEILSRTLPSFLEFSAEARSLKSSYELDESMTAEKEIPTALNNLLKAAGLEMQLLWQAITDNDQAAKQTLIDKANDKLESSLVDSWPSLDVEVRFSLDGNVLFIQIKDESKENSNIGERSDGLRQFVALAAFLLHKRRSETILLIDEAERHLHYDAQADLVQMFAEQDFVSKIIYSTHSAGCLPEDLGTGVRMITKAEKPERSVVKNWFWEDGEAGFSPILFGLGATTLAFVPLRYVVFVEGPTDFLLLPTMFRQVTERDSLGFQIAPNLAKVSKRGFGLLELEAPRTAYLTDGDDGGEAIRRNLEEAKIPKDRIFCLTKSKVKQVVLEDLIDADIYLRAVNERLMIDRGSELEMPKSVIVKGNRIHEIEKWCKKNGLKPPRKRDVAYQILEYHSQDPDILIFDSKQKTWLKKLYQNISQALGIK